MFEDEVDEVGSDVEAYCPKCKGDTTHVVISKYEDEIRRVQCNPAGTCTRSASRGATRRTTCRSPSPRKKRAMMKKPTLDEFFAKHSDKNAKPYEFREPYHENHIVFHPKFGKGFVSEVGLGQQGGGHLRGRAPRAGAQPQGHARAAAGRRGRRAAEHQQAPCKLPRSSRSREGREGCCPRAENRSWRAQPPPAPAPSERRSRRAPCGWRLRSAARPLQSARPRS